MAGTAPRSSSWPAALATTAAVAVSTAAAYLWWNRPPKPQPLHVKVVCNCEKVCLQVDAVAPVHLVCYCDDCQRYAQWVQETSMEEKSGSRRPVVDCQGGSRTCQVFRENVKIIRGKEFLQVTFLNPANVPSRPQKMHRVASTCCHTPLVSALWKELTVMGLHAANFQKDGRFLSQTSAGLWGGGQGDDDDGESFLPPPEYRINCRYAKALDNGVMPRGHSRFPQQFLFRFLWRNFFVGPRIPANDDFTALLGTSTMRAM